MWKAGGGRRVRGHSALTNKWTTQRGSQQGMPSPAAPHALATEAAGKHVCDKCAIWTNDRVSIIAIWGCHTNTAKRAGGKWSGADERHAADTIKYNKTDIDMIGQLLFTWETPQHRTNKETHWWSDYDSLSHSWEDFPSGVKCYDDSLLGKPWEWCCLLGWLQSNMFLLWLLLLPFKSLMASKQSHDGPPSAIISH